MLHFETSEPTELDTLLADCLHKLFSDGISFYLEGIGYVISHNRKRTTRKIKRDQFYLVNEIKQVGLFEKCDDPSFHQIDLPSQLYNTSEIVLELQKRGVLLPAVRVRTWLRSFFKQLRQDLVLHGISRRLSSLGTFFATGSFSEKDYGFIDVHFIPRTENSVVLGQNGPYERPILRDSFEILEAAFDKPIEKRTILLREYLGDEYQESLSIASFKVQSRSPSLIVATTGLSSQGAELVIEVPFVENIPSWIPRALALGWIGLQTISARKLIRGVVMSAGEEIAKGISHLLIHERSLLRDRHLTMQGEFMFLNVSFVHPEEAEFAERNGVNLLIKALRERSVLGLSKPSRKSIWKGLTFPETH